MKITNEFEIKTQVVILKLRIFRLFSEICQNIIFVIFSTAYLPPIEFFVYASKTDEIIIEACENFIKQTYRNRCCINTANGKLKLIVPLEFSRRPQLPLKEVKIAYTEPWNKIHWRAITAAYNKSAYFLYYRDNFEKFFTGNYKWLIEFNHDILIECLKQLRLDKKVIFTDMFNKTYDTDDLRMKINPKNNPEICFPAYTQVFDVKSGFLSNLSIIDLLFNCGPDSLEYIENTASSL